MIIQQPSNPDTGAATTSLDDLLNEYKEFIALLEWQETELLKLAAEAGDQR